MICQRGLSPHPLPGSLRSPRGGSWRNGLTPTRRLCSGPFPGMPTRSLDGSPAAGTERKSANPSLEDRSRRAKIGHMAGFRGWPTCCRLGGFGTTAPLLAAVRFRQPNACEEDHGQQIIWAFVAVLSRANSCPRVPIAGDRQQSCQFRISTQSSAKPTLASICSMDFTLTFGTMRNRRAEAGTCR